MNIQNTQVRKLPTESERPGLELSDKKPRRLGLIILLITFGIFGTWAAFAPLDSASVAPGVVSVKGNRKTVQHLEGGIVREILVSEGQQVEAGAPLLVLDKTQFGAELGTLKGQYYTVLAREGRLIAERDGKEAIEFAPDLLQVDDRRTDEAMANESQIFEARKAAREGEKEVLEQQISQLESQIEGLQALVDSKHELIQSYEEELEDLQVLLEEGFVEKTRLVELRRALSRTRGEIAEHRAAMAEAQMRVGETRLQILQLEKNFKTEVVDTLAQAQAQAYEVRQRITAIQDRVERTVVRAPVSGQVLGLNAHTVGGVIQGGKPILDIVPEDQELVVEARVSPGDIDRVSVGLNADIRFSAFHYATTPVVEGTVAKISPDRLLDEDTGDAYYAASIEVTEEGMAELSNMTLVAGMPAEVFIKTGERTLLQYLLQPAENALARSLNEE